MPRARLIILSTGGTIAMTKETAQDGAAMALCAANLIATVPRLADLAEVEALDVLAKPSADFTLADIAAIADAATVHRDAATSPRRAPAQTFHRSSRRVTLLHSSRKSSPSDPIYLFPDAPLELLG